GNFVGTDRTGTLARGNVQDGVFVGGGATNNTVGGTTATARNLISGNSTAGVTITDAGTVANTVAGNYIGTDVTGSAALANGVNGVLIQAGASNNTIGGLTATPGTGAGNVIAGNNNDAGIYLNGADSNLVQGNLIGLSAIGAPLGNLAGVKVGGASNTI